MRKFACWYGRWLSTAPQPDGKPPLLYILVFCPLGLFAAFVFGLPAFDAMRHGVAWDGSIQSVDKHNQPFIYFLRPYVTFSLVMCAVCLPLLLSGVAYLRGWFGGACDGEG